MASAVLDRLRAAGLLPASPDELRIDIADKAVLEAAAGRLYLAEREPERAREWLAHAADLRKRIDVPESPWLAATMADLSTAMAAH